MIRFSIALTLIFACIVAKANENDYSTYQIAWSNKIDEESHFVTVITGRMILDTPKWETTALPLGADAAVRESDKFIAGLQRVSDSRIETITLKRFKGEGRLWYWVIAYRCTIDGYRERKLELAVLLNGHVVSPNVTKEFWQVDHLLAIPGARLQFGLDGKVRFVSLSEQDAVTDDSLRFIKELSALETFVAIESKLNGNGFVSFEKLPRLKNIELVGSENIKDSGLHHLVDLASLASLDLSSTSVTDEGVKILSQSRSIQQLILSDTLITDHCLEHLIRFKSLRQVSVRDTKFSAASVLALRQAGIEILD